MPIISATEWDTFYRSIPEAHLLQDRRWGELKSHFGWRPIYINNGSTGTQVLLRILPAGYKIAYIPKGPIGRDWQILWPEIDQICRANRVIFLKVEPDAWEYEMEGVSEMLPGFRFSPSTIQPRRTILISMGGGEKAILESMKQKTRYNIHLAERKDVHVSFSNDISTFHNLSLITGERDGFGIHTLEYYERAHHLFSKENKCALLLAEYDSNPLAGIMVFANGQRSWYLYGASNEQERNRMPTYLLQFEAMRWAMSRGCLTYDLWGIPDENEGILESQFMDHKDGLWGVYRFKRGFGGKMVRTAGAWDKIYQPVLYRFYQWWINHKKAEVN